MTDSEGEIAQAAELERPDPEFVYAILEIFGFDWCDALFWRTDAEYAPLYIAVNCSDIFAWGGSDLEEIHPEDIPDLRQAKADCTAAGDAGDFAELWCARKRKMRPQGAYYKYIEPPMRPLFDAAGPLREVNLLNPSRHPSEKGADDAPPA